MTPDIPPWDMLNSLEVAATPTVRPNILAIGWRWRYEIGTAAILIASGIGIGVTKGLVGLISAAAITAAVIAVAMWWPASRRRILARIRCVIVQHRVRTGLASAWVQTRSGKLPVILRTVPRPFGERMLLWCRAGITPADLAAAREVLRVACWAADVRIMTDVRRPHLVTIDIIRIPRVDDVPTPEWSISPGA